MKQKCRKYLLATVLACSLFSVVRAQDVNDSSAQLTDSLTFEFVKEDGMVVDTIGNGRLMVTHDDSLIVSQSANKTIQKEDWIPNPKKALWLAIAIPGGGQIYNRKYWKLPLIYGGFLGCFYAISWNNTMYHDYAQAYVDIMDDDPKTMSYSNFLPPTYDVNANLDRLQNLFRKKKDYYRRFRDLSIFCAIGVYALSIIDAYVDAELSSFDISKDLSMKIKPSVINDRAMANQNGNSYGIKCAIAF